MADDEQPRLSTSERRRQLALDHVRAARRRIESAPRPEPEFGHGESGPPPPRVPSDPPDPTTSVEPSPDPAQLDLDSPETPEASEDDEEGEIADLVSTLEALTAKYEMEMAAHRHTADRLIEQQQQHIASLLRHIDELTARLSRDQSR